MRFNWELIIIFIVCSCIFPFSSNNTRGNPIVVDKGNNLGPLPYENTSVYLKSEIVDVTISNIAYVEASYTFANNKSKDVNFTVLLPFYSKPTGLKLYTDQVEISFSYMNYTLDSPLKKKDFIAVLIELSIPNNVALTLRAHYSRKYSGHGGGTIYPSYSFSYIVGTAGYWNHSIEEAAFVFRIPEERTDLFEAVDSGKRGAELLKYDREKGIKWISTPSTSPYWFKLYKQDGYVIGEANYSDWEPNDDEEGYLLTFLWTQTEELDGSGIQVGNNILIASYITTLIIVTSILYLIFRRVRKRKKERTE